MPKLTIDGQLVEVPAGTSILQAAEQIGIEIPVFCYHPRLSVAGNCRMCLVEVEKAPKPVASCAMPASDGMVVSTNTELVRKAREGTLEFLLINHPLDCPICDQGGECDLQDITMNYAASTGRYAENKRAVVDKNMGPLVKTTMTRCIHCTRCVRFLSEVAGVPEVGAVGRGEHMEITSYLDQSLTSELSGNIIDICPVGALTSKPYAFTARPWDLTKTETIDVMDAVGSNIRVDSRGRDVMRVLPRLHEDINQEWISDKTRFSCDGLKYQRLDRPYVRRDGKLVETTWEDALTTTARAIQAVQHTETGFLVGDLADCESIFALKTLALSLGAQHLDCRQDGAFLSTECRNHYLFNTTVSGIQQADACLLIGANPRHEATMVNAALRRRFGDGTFPIAAVGEPIDLTYPVTWLGNSSAILEELATGEGAFAQALSAAQFPMIILGMGVLQRPDAQAILSLIQKMIVRYQIVKPVESWNGYNVLHTAAARVGGLDLGFLPQKNGSATQDIIKKASHGEIKFLYLLGCDEHDISQVSKSCTIVYQGHHGDKGAQIADIILPGAAYTEKDATYVNLEGRVQRAFAAVATPGEARQDWAIIRALASHLNKTLPFDDLKSLRDVMISQYPHFAHLDQVQQAARPWTPFADADLKIARTPLEYAVNSYYTTNVVSRHSPTMSQCELTLKERSGKSHKKMSVGYA